MRRFDDMDRCTDALPKRLLDTGFSLVELLVVLLIVGLFASSALPILQSRVNVARRAGAISDLERVCHAQENFFIDYDRYATSFSELGQYFRGATRIDPRTVRVGDYTYSLSSYERKRGRGAYEVVAIANLDLGDEVVDVLIVEGGAPVAAPEEKTRGCVIIVSDDIEDSSTRIRR